MKNVLLAFLMIFFGAIALHAKSRLGLPPQFAPEYHEPEVVTYVEKPETDLAKFSTQHINALKDIDIIETKKNPVAGELFNVIAILFSGAVLAAAIFVYRQKINNHFPDGGTGILEMDIDDAHSLA